MVPTRSAPLILNSTLPPIPPLPLSILNNVPCCALFRIISPVFALMMFLSPRVELPPTIPPCSNAAKAAVIPTNVDSVAAIAASGPPAAAVTAAAAAAAFFAASATTR